jgi:hypothetical protein
LALVARYRRCDTHHLGLFAQDEFSVAACSSGAKMPMELARIPR